MLFRSGTHDTSIVARLFLSRKLIAVSTNFCETCWLDPGDSFIIAETEAVLSANSTILLHFSFAPGVSCWNSTSFSVGGFASETITVHLYSISCQ